MDGQKATQVKACLSALGRTERCVVLMFYADELTPPEISVVLDITLTQVNQIVDRFRETAAVALVDSIAVPKAKQFADQWLANTPSAAL